jgi:hypothetical protein
MRHVATAINTTRATTIITTYYTYLVGKTNPNAYVVLSPFLGMVGMRILCSRHRIRTSRDVLELIHARINQRTRFQRV